MTRARTLLSVLVGAVLSSGAVAACSKDKVETPAEQAAEPIGETETSAAERPVPSLPAPGGKDMQAAEPVAPEASAAGTEAGQDGRRGRGRERRARMLERFDRNKDGQIDDSERTAMRGERAARMIARLDSDGDGSLSRDELAAVEGQGRRRFFDVAKADANGDGAVSAAELEAHMAERMNRRRGGPDADGEPEGAAPEGAAPEGAARPQ